MPRVLPAAMPMTISRHPAGVAAPRRTWTLLSVAMAVVFMTGPVPHACLADDIAPVATKSSGELANAEGGPLRAALGAFLSVRDTGGQAGEFLLAGDVVVMTSAWQPWKPGLGFRVTHDRVRHAMGIQILVRRQPSAVSRWYAQAAGGIDIGELFKDPPPRRKDAFVGIEWGQDEGPVLALLWELPIVSGEQAMTTRRPEWFVGVKSGGYPGLLAFVDMLVIALITGVQDFVRGE